MIANVKVWDFNIEVEYEYDEVTTSRYDKPKALLEIVDYSFESEEDAEECGFYNENTRYLFESKLYDALAEYESQRMKERRTVLGK